GQPLANAVVWFESTDTGDHANRERPRERFGFIHEVPIRTDSQGRWIMGFVPTESPGFSISATHPQFAKTPVVSVSGEQSAIPPKPAVEDLWASRLITRM